jgi:plastocyanin
VEAYVLSARPLSSDETTITLNGARSACVPLPPWTAVEGGFTRIIHMNQSDACNFLLASSIVLTLMTRVIPLSSAPPVLGAVEGRVTFAGAPPPAVMAEEGSQPVLYVDDSGGLRYVVVFLPDARPDHVSTGTVATMQQRHFIFEPQVLAVRAGQTVRFTNDDPANHNVRSQDANPLNRFSVSTAAGAVGSATHRFVATPPDRPIALSCDIHSWMTAWVYVFDHRQFAVTDAAGRFRIDNIPPGHYRLSLRQPAGRLQREVAVDVTRGGTTRIDVQFNAADLGMPSR